jgi:predicted Rossmann fold nucleotide-binding protein DprA/Smf involved in DNA uptake
VSVPLGVITHSEAGYPSPWLTRPEVAPAPTLMMWGSAGRLQGREKPLVALVCSQRAPAGALLGLHEVAQSHRVGGEMVVSGFQSLVEREVLRVLLRGPAPFLWFRARALPMQRLDDATRTALDEGRLLMLSACPPTVTRPDRKTTWRRDLLMTAMADALLVGYASAGGQAERLVHQALAWHKPTYALDHPANERLFALGVERWRACPITP